MGMCVKIHLLENQSACGRKIKQILYKIKTETIFITILFIILINFSCDSTILFSGVNYDIVSSMRRSWVFEVVKCWEEKWCYENYSK